MTELLSVDGYLAAVLNHAQDATLFLNHQTVLVAWNPAAERLFGYSEAQVVGRSLDFLIPSASRLEYRTLLDALGRGNQHVSCELICCRSDGSLVQVEMSLTMARDSGRDLGIAVIARDVTERNRAAEALRNSEKLAAAGRLAALIAHEINNPLESVTNLLYLLERHDSLDQHARHYVSLASEELARIVHITRQTLGFYREPAAPVCISIAELLGNVLELYSRRIQSRGIRVDKRFGAQPEIRGFPGEMRQVFSNLIVNALEAVGDGGEVKIHLFQSRDWSHPERRGVRIVIADNGPGIPQSLRQQIFEPFYTTKGERGTGLGLWVSKGIIQKYGGSIRVRSSVQQRCRGTAFAVFLPAETRERVASAA
jgi:two-component system CheB/CheR fusion protein